jgi:hypothetical protein
MRRRDIVAFMVGGALIVAAGCYVGLWLDGYLAAHCR